jgi:hypothetical protein
VAMQATFRIPTVTCGKWRSIPALLRSADANPLD